MAAQVVSLLAYLVLTRIFSPEDFGLYNIFLSYIEVLVIISTCKYELAIVVADNDNEALSLARFTLWLNAIVSLLLLVVTTCLVAFNAMPGKSEALGWIALLVPVLVYFTGSSRVYSNICNRWHRYGQIALSETVNAVGAALAKVLFGLAGLLTVGMPLGTVLGKVAGNINYRIELRRLRQHKSSPACSNDNVLDNTTKKSMLAAARQHARFPRYVATKDFINSLSANLPLLWLALYFDKAEVGLFALALTCTFRPVNLLNTAFEKVLYARVAEKVRARQCIRHDVWRFVAIVSAAALLPMLAVWIFAEPLCSLLFGGRWSGCGFYVRCLLPWVFVILSSSSLCFISNVFGRQRTEFYFYMVLLALRVAAMVAGLWTGSFKLAIALFAASGALVAAALLLWYLHQVNSYEKHAIAQPPANHNGIKS
ncbi:MAG: oligosaccharide flippase family protein [Bacteroidales bacterium]|nr:oligosaccharide flippase family protein [Bacteroidales bacterium]